jgi:hypothetical protein
MNVTNLTDKTYVGLHFGIEDPKQSSPLRKYESNSSRPKHF